MTESKVREPLARYLVGRRSMCKQGFGVVCKKEIGTGARITFCPIDTGANFPNGSLATGNINKVLVVVSYKEHGINVSSDISHHRIRTQAHTFIFIFMIELFIGSCGPREW
jgi:hypothetical protein